MDTEPPLKLALIGTGSIAQSAHIPAWSEIEDVHISSLVDPSPKARDSAREALDKAGNSVDSEYSTTDELVENEDVDLVDITIPPGEGKSTAIKQALEAGFHVTCQKPFVHDYATAKELVDLAESQDRILSVNQQARYGGAFSRVKDWVKQGRIGDIRSIQLQADFNFSGVDRWLNFSVHSFDLIRFWTDRKSTRVMGWHKQLSNSDHYLFSVWLDYDDSMAAKIWDELASSTTLSWDFRIMGEAGSIRGNDAYTDSQFPPQIVYTPADGEVKETRVPINTRYVPVAFRRYFREVVNALLEEASVPISGRDNLRTLQLAFAAKHAADRGKWVDVSTDPFEYDP